MKIFLSVLLFALSLTGLGQTVVNFTQNTSSTDFTRPQNRGTATWQGEGPGNNGFPTPTSSSTFSDIVDRYDRFTIADISTNSPANNYSYNLSGTGDQGVDAEFNAAIDAGGKIGFGIHFQCGFCGGHGAGTQFDAARSVNAYCIYPTWWHAAMQADAVKDFSWNNQGSNEWAPNINGTTFQGLWRNLWTNWINHINTTSHFSAKLNRNVFYWEVVNYIEVSGYGQTGEWTNTPYAGASGHDGVWPGPVGTEPTVAGYDSLIGIVARIGHQFRVIAQIGTFDCNYLNQNTHIPKDVGWFALQLKTDKGPVGLRRESWGVSDVSQDYLYKWTIGNTNTFTIPSGFPNAGSTFHFDTCLQNRWKYAPIVGEPCCATDNTFSDFNNNEVGPYHLNGLDNGNSFDFGNAGGNAAGYEPNIRAGIRKSGYRIVLTSVSSTSTITSGTAFNITPTLQNVGVAPPYDDWSVVWTLATAPGAVPVWTDSTNNPANTSFIMKGFLPGSATGFTGTYTKAIAAGTYNLYMYVKDPNRYYRNMDIAITNTLNSDGGITIRTGIPVLSGSGAPVANAGPDLTINLPTSSTTLDGTGSSGTITSYTWSQLHGPNTATITSGTTATPTVSGLIAGTYMFKLALNGGGIDSMQLFVNPIIPPSPSIFSTQVPKAGTANDFTSTPQQTTTQGWEGGVRFQSTIAGYITGLRFYKTAGNNGTHIGLIYTNTGTELARATYLSETATGWQTVNITPVLIAAHTTYVAALFSASGNYTEDNHYFNGVSVTNTNLTALADGLNDGDASPDATNTTNGPWIYTASPAFPNNAYHAANYWIDVVFGTVNSNTLPFGHTIIFQKIP